MGTVSSNIRMYREQRKMTQDELAKRVGVTQTAIWMFESGKITPRLVVADKISKALGVTLEQLTEGGAADDA